MQCLGLAVAWYNFLSLQPKCNIRYQDIKTRKYLSKVMNKDIRYPYFMHVIYIWYVNIYQRLGGSLGKQYFINLRPPSYEYFQILQFGAFFLFRGNLFCCICYTKSIVKHTAHTTVLWPVVFCGVNCNKHFWCGEWADMSIWYLYLTTWSIGSFWYSGGILMIKLLLTKLMYTTVDNQRKNHQMFCKGVTIPISAAYENISHEVSLFKA